MTTRTPTAHAGTEPMGRAALLLILTAGALLVGLVTAAPAAAIDDPRRPDAHVTHGPSCRPGGVVVEVVAGTVPYAVTLATSRNLAGEDAAIVEPGETAVLRTGDVAWGETIDGYLRYAALDDSGSRYVDDLDGYTFTRPAQEDCAAIIAPPASATVPLSPTGPDSGVLAPSAETGVVVDAPAAGALPAGDGSRRTGTDIGAPAGSQQGAPARSFGDGDGDGGARAAEAVAGAAPTMTPEASLAPLLAAVVALLAAVAGLVSVAARPAGGIRRPTRNA